MPPMLDAGPDVITADDLHLVVSVAVAAHSTRRGLSVRSNFRIRRRLVS